MPCNFLLDKPSGPNYLILYSYYGAYGLLPNSLRGLGLVLFQGLEAFLALCQMAQALGSSLSVKILNLKWGEGHTPFSQPSRKFRFPLIRSAKAAGDPRLGAIFQVSILTGRCQSYRNLWDLLWILFFRFHHAASGPAHPETSSEAPRQPGDPALPWWHVPGSPKMWSSPFHGGLRGKGKVGGLPAQTTLRMWCESKKLTCGSHHGAKQAGNPGLSQPTTLPLLGFPSLVQFCAVPHSTPQQMVGKALSGCPGLEQPPKMLPSVTPWAAAQSALPWQVLGW